MNTKEYMVSGGHYDHAHFHTYDEALSYSKERVDNIEDGKDELNIYKLVAEVKTKTKTSEVVKH